MAAYLLRSFLFFRCGNAKKHIKNATQNFNKIPQNEGKENNGKISAKTAPIVAGKSKFWGLQDTLAVRKDRAVSAQSSTKFSAKTYSI